MHPLGIGHQHQIGTLTTEAFGDTLADAPATAGYHYGLTSKATFHVKPPRAAGDPARVIARGLLPADETAIDDEVDAGTEGRGRAA